MRNIEESMQYLELYMRLLNGATTPEEIFQNYRRLMEVISDIVEYRMNEVCKDE